MSHYPEVKSADLFKTTLIGMSALQRKILSQSFLNDAKSSTYFASLCGKIAIASAVLTLVSATVQVSIRKPRIKKVKKKKLLGQQPLPSLSF